MLEEGLQPARFDYAREPRRPDVSLDDRYTSDRGRAMMSGIQALVRSTLDLRRLDERRGLRTAVFVSGYQGSPLGGLDQELHRSRRHLDPAHVVFRPGINEELAATAVGGTQLLGELERRRFDGVTGFWFGKNPGLDRAADAIRHATLSGTAPLGGAVAWIGDDPSSKSSTVPSSCEPMCQSLRMPLLAPGTVEELLACTLHAVHASRHSGLWTAVKIVADIADATASVDLGAAIAAVPELPVRHETSRPMLLPPANLAAEFDLMTTRQGLALDYAEAADLNRIVSGDDNQRLTIVASGAGFQAVRRALADLALDDAALDAAGVRLVQLMMPWPLRAEEVRRLTAGAQTVLVVEDKLPFVETLVKDAHYGLAGAPAVVGKRDAEGRPLLTERSSLTSDDVVGALERLLGGSLPAQGRKLLAPVISLNDDSSAGLARRTPYFCSGCPHNTSTRAQDDQLVGVGIGCHTMVALDTADRGQLLGMPQMGGEGAQWIGLAPFTDDRHFIQNLGDGTFHHSGSLAIRAAVSAGVNITYRLLYNDAVAMTGGQRPQGNIAIPELTRWLELEGVARVVVTTPEPETFSPAAMSLIATVRHRDALQTVQRELAEVPGVTVIIHADACATEKRRRRKRGELQAPAQRIHINERVCEGCGDCGEKSTCLSVLPVATEFGRKTQIEQSSCNQDFSCLKGDCPSFLTVTPRQTQTRTPAVPDLPVTSPLPVCRVPADVLIRMPGIGGTGVVTISQILQMAVHLDGRFATGLEQIGLAQKGGPVMSDLRISSAPVCGQLRASARRADVLLVFDILGGAAAETVAVADPSRTVAVVNVAATPTARQVLDPTAASLSPAHALRRIRQVTDVDGELTVDANALAQRLFADHMPANMIMVGAAFQHGVIPIGLPAIEQAIRLNGAAVESNLAAFRWGRAVATDPSAVAAALASPGAPPKPADPRTAAIVAGTGAKDELQRILALRVDELIGYEDVALAERYAEDVARVLHVERERVDATSTPITAAYARNLFKLLAYKDEYEVARLHLDTLERAKLSDGFGADAKVEIMLLPPTLRARGRTRKVALDGRWAYPALAVLARGRRLRGTRLDPFGRAEVRRLERALAAEYRDLVTAALQHLRPENARQVAAIAELPDLVRGYEDVKLRSVERFRAEAAAQLEDLVQGRERKVHASLPMVHADRREP